MTRVPILVVIDYIIMTTVKIIDFPEIESSLATVQQMHAKVHL